MLLPAPFTNLLSAAGGDGAVVQQDVVPFFPSCLVVWECLFPIASFRLYVCVLLPIVALDSQVCFLTLFICELYIWV